MSGELDELIEMARDDTDDAGGGNPMSRKARDMGHPRRSFAYGNVKIENDSIPLGDDSQGGGAIGREVSGRSASCPVGRVCGA